MLHFNLNCSPLNLQLRHTRWWLQSRPENCTSSLPKNIRHLPQNWVVSSNLVLSICSPLPCCPIPLSASPFLPSYPSPSHSFAELCWSSGSVYGVCELGNYGLTNCTRDRDFFIMISLL